MSKITDCVLRIVYKETAKEMWAALCTKYEVKDIQGINFTRRKFFNCKQETNESVENFIERVVRLREELATAGHEIKDKDSFMTIMQGISSSYEIYLQLLTVNKKPEDLELEEIKNALLLEEKRRNEMKNGNTEQQRMIKCFSIKRKVLKSRKGVFFNCNKAGHLARDCKFDKNKCYNCNKLGHLSPHCKLPKSNKDKNARANKVKE